MNRWLAILSLAVLAAACQPAPQTPVIQTDLLVPGQTVEQALAGPDGEHHWLFAGQAGQQITVTFQPLGVFLDLILYGPSGSVILTLAGQTGSPTALSKTAQLPQDGTYRLVVSLRAATSTTYRLTVAETTSPPPATSPALTPATPIPPPADVLAQAAPSPTVTSPPLRVGSGARLQPYRAIRGQITDFGASEHYTIFAPAGTVVTIGAFPVPGSPVSPALTLYAPSGDILAESGEAGSGEAGITGIQLPVTGAYVLYVRASGDRATGPYDLSFGYGQTLRENVQPEPAPDIVYNGLLNQPLTRDLWPVKLNIGDIISAAAVANGGRLSPVLTLLAPDGQPLYTGHVTDSESSAALQQVIAPQTGQFYLAVAPAESGQSGSYTLLWQYNARAPTPPPGR